MLGLQLFIQLYHNLSSDRVMRDGGVDLKEWKKQRTRRRKEMLEILESENREKFLESFCYYSIE